MLFSINLNGLRNVRVV